MEAKRKYRYEPDYAIAPGETLLEVCESMDMSKKELAARLELTEQTINRIVKGIQPITYITANKLELVTGIAARFWNKLEANYREQLAKMQETEQLSKDISWLKKIPYNDLVKRGFIESSDNKTEQLRNILQFFGVSSVVAWENIWKSPSLAARRSLCFASHPETTSAWIRCGEVIASKIDCEEYHYPTFKKVLTEIRKLTLTEPAIFLPQMIELCRQAGVALAFVPKMQKLPWNGASRWLSKSKALIMLSNRGKTEDKFWFSFFHEAAHIIQDSKKGLYIADGSNDPIEIDADNFAADLLIPQPYNEIIQNLTSQAQLITLAQELSVSPGIVAGRYQYLSNNWHKFNNLIRSFNLAQPSLRN